VTPDGSTAVTTLEQLVELVGVPHQRVADKVRPALADLDRKWIAASPFCLVATSDARGRCDVSPKGDPSGVAHVLDDRTLVLPDRPGNRRVDGFRNVLENPHAGVLFLLPGRGDTLRVNGRAHLVSDAPWFDDLVVEGHPPRLALVLDVEEVFHHCAKAFLRSRLWEPETWRPDALPSTAVLAKRFLRLEEPVEQIEEYYGQAYAEGLYRA